MKQKSYILMAGSMFLFGTIGIFRRYIPLPSGLLAMCRGFIGMSFLLIAVLFRHKMPSKMQIINNLPVLLLSGAFIGFNWILLFEAYRYTTVATATLCYYMAPVIVILASPFILKEKLSPWKIICVIIALSGMVLISGVLSSGVSGPRGILLGLGAALLYASVILLNKFLHGIGAFDKTIVQLGSAALVLVPYVLFLEPSPAMSPSPFVISMVFIVGILHTGIAYTMYFGAMEQLPAQTIALLGYIDPIVAILLSALLLHEPIGTGEIIGAILVLSATICSEFLP